MNGASQVGEDDKQPESKSIRSRGYLTM